MSNSVIKFDLAHICTHPGQNECADYEAQITNGCEKLETLFLPIIAIWGFFISAIGPVTRIPAA